MAATLSTLPVEIIRYIIKLSSSLEQSRTNGLTDPQAAQLAKCCLVNRLWRDLAQPLLVEHISIDCNALTTSALELTLASVPSALVSCVRTVDLYCADGAQSATEESLDMVPLYRILGTFSNVREVMLTDTSLNLDIFLGLQPNLRVLYLDSCSVNIDTGCESRTPSFLHLLGASECHFGPHLKFLRSDSSSLRGLSLDACTFTDLCKCERSGRQAVTLSHLDLTLQSLDQMHEVERKICETGHTHFCLHHVDVEQVSSTSDTANVTHLELSGMVDLYEGNFYNILCKCTSSLTHLTSIKLLVKKGKFDWVAHDKPIQNLRRFMAAKGIQLEVKTETSDNLALFWQEVSDFTLYYSYHWEKEELPAWGPG